MDSKEYESANFVSLREVSFACSTDELRRLSLFFKQIYDEVKSCDFSYGACTIQFRDRDALWQAGDPDVVLIVAERGDDSVVSLPQGPEGHLD